MERKKKGNTKTMTLLSYLPTYKLNCLIRRGVFEMLRNKIKI